MKNKLILVATLIAFVLALRFSASDVIAQEPNPRALRNALGTAFTYQGQLKDNGTAANGAYDFQFKLFDAPVGGGQVGSTFTANDVNVTNGYFTVSLDFGAVFDGSERDLEIAVRPGASTGGYTTLTPRQQLTATPYALYAKNGWSLRGNNGTTAGTNFVGTTDNVALELKVNNARALRLEPNGTSPNVIGGHSGNNVTTNVFGATIAGGGTSAFTHRVTDNFGTVGGGSNNQAGDNAGTTSDKQYATIGGGSFNTASGQYSTVGAGIGNTASGDSATIGGGGQNTASGFVATISGGSNNNASGEDAAIGGGIFNSASGQYSTVGGGIGNAASGAGATVGGGDENTTSGSYSTVPGGRDASATHYGEIAQASGRFTADGDAQTSTYVLRNTTTNETPRELFLDGDSVRLTIASNRVMTFDILVVGTNINNGNSAGYRLSGVIKNIGGITSFTGTPNQIIFGEDNASLDATVIADDPHDALVVQVEGGPNATIRWVATVRTAEVSY